MQLPSFIILGAMKCATTTIYEQLKQQSGIFLPELKEPNFYSDDEVFEQGYDWYESLFKNAAAEDIVGEASTHYTKLPTYPNTISRLKGHNKKANRFIYVMRHPIKRLVSHYIHDWSENKIKVPINEAIFKHPELIEYSLYSKQITPWVEEFGRDSILPVFFEQLMKHGEVELSRICRFIGYDSEVKWHLETERTNVSSERIRKFPLYSLIVENQISTSIRRNLISKRVRENVKRHFQMKERPSLSHDNEAYLKSVFDRDLRGLESIFEISLDCDSFESKVKTYRNGLAMKL